MTGPELEELRDLPRAGMKAPRSSKPRARSPASAALVQKPLGGAPVDRSGDRRFAEVVALVEAARRRAYQAVNTELVAHYWELGAYISAKIASAEWGDGVVAELAAALARSYPGVRGYTRSNLFRMRQLYEAYRGSTNVAPLVRQLPWTHHLIILGEAKPVEARSTAT